jgi:hypothetical protein
MPQQKAPNPPPVIIEMPAPAAQEGLPNPASVVGEKTLISPTGRKYTILKTTEVDASDRGKTKGKKRKRKVRKRP